MGKGRYSWLTCNNRVLIDCDTIHLYISVWNSYAQKIYRIFSIVLSPERKKMEPSEFFSCAMAM